MATHKNIISDSNKTRGFIQVDSLGIGASIICLIHCAVLPFIVPFFASLVSHDHYKVKPTNSNPVDQHTFHAHTILHDVSNSSGVESLFSLLEIGLHFLLFPALFFIALYALAKGFRNHGKLSVVALGSGGVSLLFCGLLLEGSSQTLFNFNLFRLTPDMLATIIGSVLLLLAHIKNLKACTCPSVVCRSNFAHSSTSKVSCCSTD